MRLSDGKMIPPTKEGWGLRRFAIGDGSVVVVEPTIEGAWFAHDQEYYVKRFVSEIRDAIEAAGGVMSYSKLNSLVKVPPVFPTTLRVFLRKYPEHFYIHTDTSTCEVRFDLSHHNLLYMHIAYINKTLLLCISVVVLAMGAQSSL